MSSFTDGPSERKVQLTGGTTYTVSLPKEWADEHDVSVGTRLHIYPHCDRSLVVRSVRNGSNRLGRDGCEPPSTTITSSNYSPWV